MPLGMYGVRVMKTSLVLLLLLVGSAWGQDGQAPKLTPRVPKVVPVPMPKMPMRAPEGVQDAKLPAARTVTDNAAGVTFRLPAGWNMEQKDGELSTFHLDARTASKRAQLRVVANMNWNPFPQTTFSGALFYLSVTPRTSAVLCAGQTTTKPDTKIAGAVIDDVRFNRGKDEHGGICTEARDIAYTAFRAGSCVRFDLAVNTFCGGEVSGAQDMTDTQLTAVFGRMEGILQTVTFTRK